MMSSSAPHILTDHALYKLQDKVNKMPRGFAFIKMDPSFDNSEGDFDFVPVSSDITTAINGDQVEMIRLLAEAINEESAKHELGVVETDLNLSEASSTNDTTVDECRSVTSFLSPIMLPVKYHDDVGFTSVQSTASVSPVESNENEENPVIEEHDHKEGKNVILEDVFSPVVGSPRCVSLASFTVASLAAEVVSEINANEKVDEGGLVIKKDVMQRKPSTERDEVEGCFGSRNAKEVLSEDDFNKFSKPFSLGWKRECVTKDNLISDIYYIAPPSGNVQRKRLRNPSSIKKYLSEERNESNLMLENFSFKRVFMGFESQHEVFRLAANKSNPPSGNNRMYVNFFEMVAEDTYRCLLCGNLIKQKGNRSKHVKRVHEPHVKCKTCGKDFNALLIQSHQDKCTAEFKDVNDTEMFGAAKRKAAQDSVESTEKIQRVAKLGFPINPVQEIVDMKSSPPLCQGNSSLERSPFVEESAGADTEDYCEIIEPDNQDILPLNTSEIELVKIDEQSFNAQHGDIKIPSEAEDQLPVRQEITSDIDSKKNSSIRMVTLEMSSVEGTRIKMQVRMDAKLRKGMKKFGLRMGVRYQDLRFILDGMELTGKELAEGHDGAKILVERRVE